MGFGSKMKQAFSKPVGLVSNFATYTKKYWKVPPEGRYVSNKEFTMFVAGASGNWGIASALNVLSFAATCFLVGNIYGIGFIDIYIIGFLCMPFDYLLTPLHSMITDNLGRLSKKMNISLIVACIIAGAIAISLCFIPKESFESIMIALPQILGIVILKNIFNIGLRVFVLRIFAAKYGKFKPWLVVCGVPSIILATVIAWLPIDITSPYATRLIVIYALFSVFDLLRGNFTGNLNNIANVISPNTDERTSIFAYGSFMWNLVPSIWSMFFPVFAGITGGLLDVRTYRFIIPIWCIVMLVPNYCLIKGVKERVITSKTHRAKVSFRKGASAVLKNKYFWIINISNVLASLAGSAGLIITWMFIYGLRQEALSGILCAGLLMTSCIPGMIFAPIMIKKLGKKKIILISRGLELVSLFAILAGVYMNSVALVFITSYIKNFAGSAGGVAGGMVSADVWDYQQYISNERLDGFSGIFSMFTMPFNQIIGFITPFIYGIYGLTTDWGVMYDGSVRFNIFVALTILAIVSLALGMIPYFFYNLTEKRHKEMIDELRLRADAEDLEHEGNQQNILNLDSAENTNGGEV